MGTRPQEIRGTRYATPLLPPSPLLLLYHSHSHLFSRTAKEVEHTPGTVSRRGTVNELGNFVGEVLTSSLS